MILPAWQKWFDNESEVTNQRKQKKLSTFGGSSWRKF